MSRIQPGAQTLTIYTLCVLYGPRQALPLVDRRKEEIMSQATRRLLTLIAILAQAAFGWDTWGWLCGLAVFGFYTALFVNLPKLGDLSIRLGDVRASITVDGMASGPPIVVGRAGFGPEDVVARSVTAAGALRRSVTLCFNDVQLEVFPGEAEEGVKTRLDAALKQCC